MKKFFELGTDLVGYLVSENKSIQVPVRLSFYFLNTRFGINISYRKDKEKKEREQFSINADYSVLATIIALLENIWHFEDERETNYALRINENLKNRESKKYLIFLIKKNEDGVISLYAKGVENDETKIAAVFPFQRPYYSSKSIKIIENNETNERFISKVFLKSFIETLRGFYQHIITIDTEAFSNYKKSKDDDIPF